jgi:hypothetical protein
MRWKLKFKPDWEFLLNSFGNAGVGIFTTGIISQIFSKPGSKILIICGFLTILLAWTGKSIKIKKRRRKNNA